MALRSTIVMLLAVSASAIRVTEKCTPLESGAKISLKSNLLENHFITMDKGTGDCGVPANKVYPETEKHWNCSKFLLKKGQSENTTFRIVSKKGGPIHSGDEVKLVVDKDGSEVHLNSEEYQWPYPLATKKHGTDFVIQHARKVELLDTLKMCQLDGQANTDTKAGKPICNGDHIFMYGKELQYVKDKYVTKEYEAFDKYFMKKACPSHLMYLQGDMDKIVGFLHHYPGMSGKPENLRNQLIHVMDPGNGALKTDALGVKYYADDENSSAQRFTIVEEKTEEKAWWQLR